MIVVCATDDLIHFADDHFGDAKYYQLYEITDKYIQKLEEIDNTANIEYEVHKHKAINVLKLFHGKNIDAMVNTAFGKNITVIIEHTVPILPKELVIEKGLNLIKESLNEIEEIMASKTKFYLRISENNGVMTYEL
ncbi:MAG: hypothetical protein B6I17_00850 [Tenericutes bacterium 4572_104]|nr:MAG: hypothetical protein B6I17_00850 [Tenericutes bacterium 4572_104]